LEEHLTSIAVGIAGPAILGVFAFLWKVNSRLAGIERKLEAHDHRIKDNRATLSKHFDKAFTIRKSVSEIDR
jgi:hypothetical protein|tara:strand:- start:701 stop:916 length:216 start_codon:yes stop_codon:yes gene_type:complete